MGSGRGRRPSIHVVLAAALAALIALLGASTASANTVLHVDAVHGHDTGNCQSAPCKTLSYAAGQGRLVPDLITIQAAAGTYTGDLSLGAADSGLAITGVGSGTNPATNTIIRGVLGNPTINTTTAGDASSLSLAHLRMVNPTGDTSPAFLGATTSLKLNDVPVLTPGGGPGLVDSDADVTLLNSPIKLGPASGTGFAIAGGSMTINLTGSSIDVKDDGGGIANGGAPVTVTNSPITLEGTTGSNFAIANGGAAVTVTGSAIDVKGSGGGIANGGAPVTVTNSPITLEGTSGSDYGIANGGAAVTVTGSAIDVKGRGGGVANGGAPVTVSKSPITLENTAGSDFAIANGGGAVAVGDSPIVVHGTGGGVANGSAPVTVSNSSIKLLNTSGSDFAIVNGNGAVGVGNSPITVHGTGGGIANGGAPVTVIASPIKLLNTSGSDPAIVNGGAPLTVQKSDIDVKGLAAGISNAGGTTTLSGLDVTLENAVNNNPALVSGGGGSSLSHVTISGAWSGAAISDNGSLAIADSTLTSGASPIGPLVSVSDGGSKGREISITRSVLTQHSTTHQNVAGDNVNLAAVSSELLGGSSGLSTEVTSGAVRTVTIVSSTIDAGALGSRDASPITSLTANADNTSGSRVLVNVEGSILVEAPGATLGGASGIAEVNCSHTEVPSTTQVATSTLGTISCAGGARGNTSTSSLSAIFATPITKYRLNPSWNGVDSVPASAISVPAPFSDSATDLLGSPRALNGAGTCLPGVRDKGAIELTGHGGVVPKPKISGPSTATEGVLVTFTGHAPNLLASVHPTFTWHTSDGSSGTGKHFSHKFGHTGRSKVSLKVTGAAACTATTSKKVKVSAPKHKHGTRKAQRRA